MLGRGFLLAFIPADTAFSRSLQKMRKAAIEKTEFDPVVDRLDIGLINELTPQAEGRVGSTMETCGSVNKPWCCIAPYMAAKKFLILWLSKRRWRRGG